MLFLQNPRSIPIPLRSMISFATGAISIESDILHLLVFSAYDNRTTIPIINKMINDNNIKLYIEPFVVGCNMIENIECENRLRGQ